MATNSLFQHPLLDGSSFEWKGNSTGILLFHGFTATTVEVRLMAQFLLDMGFTVQGPLLPGHGHTPEEMNQVSWNDWVKCAENAYTNLFTECDKIFVLGESMGGLVALSLCIAHPEIAGAMLFAPALKVPGLGQSELFWPFKKYIWKKNIDESMDWQGFNVIPLHAAAQMVKFQRYIRHKLLSITNPTLIFQGKLDKTIDVMSSVDVLETIHSSEKELIWLEESTHCILLDQQLPDTEILCLEFIKAHS